MEQDLIGGDSVIQDMLLVCELSNIKTFLPYIYTIYIFITVPCMYLSRFHAEVAIMWIKDSVGVKLA